MRTSGLLEWAGEVRGVRLGALLVEGVRAGPAPPQLRSAVGAEVERVRESASHPPEELRCAVRDMLRAGGFKPAGRSKPASEFLVRAARTGRFPEIDVLVDANNLVSLATGLPCSIFDGAKIELPARVRLGRAGESYVFNSAGQSIDLEGLVVVCTGDTPCGSPVKDSMATKVGPSTERCLAVVYAPATPVGVEPLDRALDHLARLLEEHAGGHVAGVQILDPAPSGQL